MTRIKVLTVEGQPTFEVSWRISPKLIAERVLKMYGTQQDGSRHEWVREVVLDVR